MCSGSDALAAPTYLYLCLYLYLYLYLSLCARGWWSCRTYLPISPKQLSRLQRSRRTSKRCRRRNFFLRFFFSSYNSLRLPQDHKVEQDSYKSNLCLIFKSNPFIRCEDQCPIGQEKGPGKFYKFLAIKRYVYQQHPVLYKNICLHATPCAL